MKAKLVSIGNSKGIRIPKAVLDQCRFTSEVELEVRAGALVIKASKKAREGWDKAFTKMHEVGDDALLDDEVSSSAWDEKHWKW